MSETYSEITVSETTNWHKRLKWKLIENGMTQRALSEKTGININSIAKYSEGTISRPRGDKLVKIASALNTTEQYLLFGTEK